MTGLEFNIGDLFEEAKKRWLKPIEVLYIIQNHDQCKFTNMPVHKPPGESIFLFNRRVLRFFRKDGHNWRKKKDGKTLSEAHERLKVGNVEVLNCYYAHGEENRGFQRRSYWMLDPLYEHIVLVHYRETNKGTSKTGPATQLSQGPTSAFSQNRGSYTTENPGTASIFGDSCEPNQTFSSAGSLEITSDMFITNNGMDHLDKTNAQAFRQLEEQLSLNDDGFKEVSPFYNEHETPNEMPAAFSGPEDHEQPYDGYAGTEDCIGNNYHESLDPEYDYPDGNEKSLYWTEVLESCKSVIKLPEQHEYEAFENEKSQFSSGKEMIANQENGHWMNSNSRTAQKSVFSFPQDIGVEFSPYSLVETQGTNSENYETLFDQIQFREPVGADSGLTVAQKQMFTIRAVSPEYCYANEATKVIIVGSFLCLPSDSTWACMFGDVEVPAEIIQDGVICCKAPSHLAGKVTLCVTSGNREPCSEVKEFEFRNESSSCSSCNSLKTEAARSPEELLLLVRFAQMLLSASTIKDDSKFGSHLPEEQKADDDSWNHVIDALLVGCGTSTGTISWLLEELLKDKLQHWVSFRSLERDEGTDCSLSKKEQGIIHMVSGLGFEWALNPILSCGVNVNFRDINGWTALHWAARVGREKMVASLIAAGASARAVTDPCSQDPSGKTAASIAASNGHKGLAGYLAEVDLTSHLSSLTLEKSEASKGSSELDAELTVSGVSNENHEANEDGVSLNFFLDAYRNAAQAAARIQAAFRAHSFRKRKEREAAAAIAGDCFLDGDVWRYYNSAARSIQKKYRGWKGRKDFLALRQKIIKIQAHVRGYQVRLQYKLIIWAVGIVDKVVLRWHRKRIGLRSSQPEMESNEESDGEDFLKVFRQEKVNVAIEKALKRVLSMVRSTDARKQYSRMVEKFRQAKVDVRSRSDETQLLTSEDDAWNWNIEDDDLHQILWEPL